MAAPTAAAADTATLPPPPSAEPAAAPAPDQKVSPPPQPDAPAPPPAPAPAAPPAPAPAPAPAPKKRKLEEVGFHTSDYYKIRAVVADLRVRFVQVSTHFYYKMGVFLWSLAYASGKLGFGAKSTTHGSTTIFQ
jgi:hypothetical protein